jgi:hypothetical protein
MLRGIRARLAVLSTLTLSVHVGVLVAAIVAVCCDGGEHHHSASAVECHVPTGQAQACPMHRTDAPKTLDEPSSESGSNGASLGCHCGATFVDNLLATTPFILDRTTTTPHGLIAMGTIAPLEPTTRELPSQVLPPPPRAQAA